jgi:uncharacterized protein (DUF427 family)
MKALWNNQVIAEAPTEQLIRIEGNWYFPPESIQREFFKETDTHTTCHWKGEASYYSVRVNGHTNEDAAWYYAAPLQNGIDQVKKDFTDYVAFWRGVEIRE